MFQNYKPAVKYGVIMGMIMVIFSLTIWALVPDIMSTMKWMLINGVLFLLALPIVMQILGARDSKKLHDAFPYGKAFQAAFYVALVAVLIQVTYTFLFNFVIDPGFTQEMGEQIAERTYEALEDRGMPEEDIDKQIDKINQRIEDSSSPLGILKSNGFMLGWYTILALLIGIVYKDPKDINKYE